jgi:hypothetical protein
VASQKSKELIEVDSVDLMVRGPTGDKVQIETLFKELSNAMEEVEQVVGISGQRPLPKTTHLDLFSMISHVEKMCKRITDFTNLEKYGQAFFDKLNEAEQNYEKTLLPEQRCMTDEVYAVCEKSIEQSAIFNTLRDRLRVLNEIHTESQRFTERIG